MIRIPNCFGNAKRRRSASSFAPQHRKPCVRFFLKRTTCVRHVMYLLPEGNGDAKEIDARRRVARRRRGVHDAVEGPRLKAAKTQAFQTVDVFR
jgi:hypothetical protein